MREAVIYQDILQQGLEQGYAKRVSETRLFQ